MLSAGDTADTVPTLTGPQQWLAERFAADLGLTVDLANRLAWTCRDKQTAAKDSDDMLVTYIGQWRTAGFPDEQLPDWVGVSPLSQQGRLYQARVYRDLVYNGNQFRVVYGLYEQIWILGLTHPDLEGHAAWQTWNSIVKTNPPADVAALAASVPQDFLNLCLRTGNTDTTVIIGWDERRRAGDPHIEGQLKLLAGLRRGEPPQI